MFTETPREIVTQNCLTPASLLDLAEERILAIRIPQFVPENICREISQRILGDPYGLKGYCKIPEILTDGRAFYDSPPLERRENYYRHALDCMNTLRALADPYPAPFDRLRVTLDDIWPSGANLLVLAGRKHWVGMTRVFRDAAEALPHQDIIGRDAPHHPDAQFLNQIAANVYLLPAIKGGELELWDWRPSDAEFAETGMPNSYGFDRTRILPSCATLSPRVGELILFSSAKVHAVRPTYEGARVTSSGFIGYRGRNCQLALWS